MKLNLFIISRQQFIRTIFKRRWGKKSKKENGKKIVFFMDKERLKCQKYHSLISHMFAWKNCIKLKDFLNISITNVTINNKIKILIR